MITLETERLLLRGWRDDDLDALAAMNADPEVMRYISDGSVRDREQSAAALRKAQENWEAHGYGLFAVEVLRSGELAGWAGFAVPEFLPEVLPAMEIGWRLSRQCWGRGYASEAAAAALGFGFETIDTDRFLSIRHVDNARSARVMEKIGMSYAFDTVVPVVDQPVAVHAITRDQYRSRAGQGA